MVDIKKSVPLAPYTTFGIGGSAKFFVEVNSIQDLTEAVTFAKDNNSPIFVLGGGSNILISDGGFNGLVIKINVRGINYLNTQTGLCIRAGAGEMWDDVVAKTVELKAGGLENLSFIPGTVGGAVYQNIGGYGAEVKDTIESVLVFDISTSNIVRLSGDECGFDYRFSIFKKNRNFIILEVELLLSKEWKPNLSYPDLKVVFDSKTPTITEVREAVVGIRKRKIYYPKELGSAGSFFKNPSMKISNYRFLISKHSDLKSRHVGNGLVKLSAAQLIEKAGWKGKRIGNVGVADKHALVLVNYGGGKSKELDHLAADIIKSVRAKFDVTLEPEVEKVP